MFDLSVINVVIGLILIFLLYSLFASALQEALAALRNRRGRMLYRGIKAMLSNTPSRRLPLWALLFINQYSEKTIKLTRRLLRRAWTRDINGARTLLRRLYSRSVYKRNTLRARIFLYDRFYDHPIIKNFGQNDIFSKPSYISDKVFASVLIDVLKDTDKRNKNKAVTYPMLKSAFELRKNFMERDVVRILNYHFNEAAGDLDVFRSRLEKWFNDSMDRVSGWYKRATQFWLFGLGFFIALSFNIDTIEITKYLSKNKDAAEQLARMGTAAAANPALSGRDTITSQVLDSIKARMANVNTLLGLGWDGSGDTTFRNRVLENKKNKAKYDGFRFKARKEYAKAKQKFIESRAGKDSLETQQQLRKLTSDSAEIVQRNQFNLLYGSSNLIKARYMLYSLGMHPVKIISFLIAALAISMGAPFWFDLLNKFVNIRTAGKVSDTSGTVTKNNISESNTAIEG